MTTPKLRPEVFEQAMELIAYDDGESNIVYKAQGCCRAISRTARDCFNMHLHFFEHLFKGREHAFWWPLYEPGYTSRIIALQLAACVARDENRTTKKGKRK